MEVCVVVKPIFSSTVSQKTASQLFIMFVFYTCDASGVAADEKATRLQTIRSGFKPTTSDMTNT